MTNNKKPSQQEMIDIIYEKIANKELSFGCRIFHQVGNKKGFEGKIITDEIKRDDGIFYGIVLKTENSVTWLPEKDIIIIGHPVMIGDVIDFIHKIIEYKKKYNMTPDNKWQEVKDSIIIFSLWKDKRKSIEEQDDKLVRYIYNLIQ